MLEGKLVNLRACEKDDLGFYVDLFNNLDALGEYYATVQFSKSEVEKRWENPTTLATVTEVKRFIVEKKDGTRIGYINHYLVQPYEWMEIGYVIIPSERGKGYCTEAVKTMVDFLFLSKNIIRIQAVIDVKNIGSKKVLEKVGFQREGTIRRSYFNRGDWRDLVLYSILKEEWKEPRILTKTVPQK